MHVGMHVGMPIHSVLFCQEFAVEFIVKMTTDFHLKLLKRKYYKNFILLRTECPEDFWWHDKFNTSVFVCCVGVMYRNVVDFVKSSSTFYICLHINEERFQMYLLIPSKAFLFYLSVSHK